MTDMHNNILFLPSNSVSTDEYSKHMLARSIASSYVSVNIYVYTYFMVYTVNNRRLSFRTSIRL